MVFLQFPAKLTDEETMLQVIIIKFKTNQSPLYFGPLDIGKLTFQKPIIILGEIC